MPGVFVDPNSVENPTTGQAASAAWGDTVRDDLVAVYGKPRVRLHKSTSQSITTGLVTVTFDQELTDHYSMHSAGLPTRITVPTNWSGDYLVGATVVWNPSTSGTFRHVELFVNDAVIIDEDTAAPTGVSGYSALHVSTLWPGAVAGDFFTLKVSQDTGSALDVISNGYAGTHFWASFDASGTGA